MSLSLEIRVVFSFPCCRFYYLLRRGAVKRLREYRGLVADGGCQRDKPELGHI